MNHAIPLDALARLLQRKWPGDASDVAAPALHGAAAAMTALGLRLLHPHSWVVAIVAGSDELEALHADLLTMAPRGTPPPLLLPPPEGGEGVDIELDGARLAVARRLFGGTGAADGQKPKGDDSEKDNASQDHGRNAGRDAVGTILLTTASALLAPLPDPKAVAAAGSKLRAGAAGQPFGELVEALVASGYSREAEVVAKGQLAVRGGLLDVWPPDAPLPLRADFFGDTLESLHSFEPASQRSVQHLESAWVPPCNIGTLSSTPSVECLPSGALLLWIDHDRLASLTRSPGDELPSTKAWDDLRRTAAGRAPSRQIFCGEPAPPRLPALPVIVSPAPGLAGLADDADLPDLRATARHKLLAGLEARARADEQVIIYLDTAGGVEWLSRELPPDTAIEVRSGILAAGCEWPELKLVLLGQPDIYAIRKQPGRRLLSATANRGERVERGDEIRPGELVVHVDHGIGRFEGTTEIDRDGQRVEVMTISYANGARLHVPTSHAHLLSRYVGVGGQDVPLHRLGGTRWRKEMIKAERSITDLAASLLEVQARRNARPGIPCDVSPPWMHAFEASFSFVETPDQTRCITEVKEDLAAARPMDRLICGDAGYGKTEVAMRAAFAIVMNGRQVAVLCPTTVLAEQHYETFRERMSAFPVRIEVLSRFRTHGRRAATLVDLARGAVDILIGTHALLQSRVVFKDLGLVVIDEEQRFGVAHKERLKHMRATVDVLTLSATPIPRTLYMSMTGARDMSLLQTPPQDRLTIETRIERDSDTVIRAAIMAELARDGQVYFLYNRVLTIGMMHKRLQLIVPEARIAVAHGQQSAAELAGTMRSFGQGAYDVLLCTTIIESGLDIPRANTIIIHRADRFGLADLYQLRGRVGRSARRGFAYLLLPPQGLTDEEARQRIGALQRHGGLGGGLHLALRDLEIRGAGNMLGSEQSGHIAAVGFTLYCQLLRRTVARLKGDSLPPLIDVELALDFLRLSPGVSGSGDAACLPYGYIDDEAQRIRIHRRLAEAATVEEVRSLRSELTDRYGKAPPEVPRLLRTAELRIMAASRGFVRIETRGEKAYLFGRDRQPQVGSSGLLPRLRSRTADQKLGELLRLVSSSSGGHGGNSSRPVARVAARGRGDAGSSGES